MKLLKFFLTIILFSVFPILNAQDWPQSNTYKEANQKIGLPGNGEKRVVFMGNSITEEWIKICPEFFPPNYVNRGISGQTTPQMLIRFRQDVIDLKPTTVVLLAGVNDIAGNTGPSSIEMICNNIMSMVELARMNNIQVILCSVLPAYEFPWAKDKEPAEKIIELNQWIENYARENNYIYVDYYSSMVDERKGLKSEYSEDGVHPNRNGYEVMMPLLEKAIQQTL